AEYSSSLLGIHSKIIAITAIVLVSAIHWFGVKAGGLAQNILTGTKLLLITFFCLAPFFISGGKSGISFLPQLSDWDLITSSSFAVSLVFVVYAYTGWNAAAYIAGNLENPVKNLPKSLIIGTLVVVVVYLSLNAMFLYTATFDELNGKNDIGNVVAVKLMGPEIGTVFSGIFSIALLSTLSAMTIAGPRVLEAMGDDYPTLKIVTAKNKYDMPYLAIMAQAAWS
ncbi:MAG: APC family permease, partial [Flammeovirgaceae bacterium]